ncbi:hypothetical protein ACMFMG_000166 [Clarireedia jacksonii]
MYHNHGRLTPYSDLEDGNNSVESTTPVLSGVLAPPPPNASNKPARKEFLNQHYVKLAVDEIVRLKGKRALEQGMRLKFSQKGGTFSLPAPTRQTCLLNAEEHDRYGKGLGSMTNAMYNMDISLVAPPTSRRGYNVAKIKEQFIIAVRVTARNVRRRGVREKAAQMQARAEEKKERGAERYIESEKDRKEKERKEESKEQFEIKKLAKAVQQAAWRDLKAIDRDLPGWETAEKRRDEAYARQRKVRKLLRRYEDKKNEAFYSHESVKFEQDIKNEDRGADQESQDLWAAYYGNEDSCEVGLFTYRRCLDLGRERWGL